MNVRYPAQEQPPRELVPQDLVHSAQASRYLGTSAAMLQGGLAAAEAGSRPWHHPGDAGFIGMHNARVTGSWRLLPRFQKKPEKPCSVPLRGQCKKL